MRKIPFPSEAKQFSTMPSWSSKVDVNVYHPHGLLPNEGKDKIVKGIVLAQIHYDRIMGDSKNIWRQKIVNILRSNTCLFIGLSGADNNLSNILTDVKDSHASKECNHRYWGIRFSDDEADPMRSKWENRGIYQQTLDNYNQIPEWLFEICQRASQQHRIRT